MRLIDADRYEVEAGDEVVITFRFEDGREVTAILAPGFPMELADQPNPAEAVFVANEIRRLLGGTDTV